MITLCPYIYVKTFVHENANSFLWSRWDIERILRDEPKKSEFKEEELLS